MKNLLVAGLFFWSQIFSVQIVQARSVKKDAFKPAQVQIEQLKFSDLILSKHDFDQLSVKDKATYHLAMVAFAMVLEKKQQEVMGYDDNITTQTSGFKFEWSSTTKLIVSNLFMQVHAAVPVLVAGALWAGGRALIGVVSSRMALSAALKILPKTAEAASKAMGALSTKIINGKVAVTATEKTLPAARDAIKAQISHLKELEKARGLAKSAADKAKFTKEIAETEKNLGIATVAFRASTGTQKELVALTTGTRFERAVSTLWSGAVATAKGTVVFAGADVLLKEATGSSIIDLFKEGSEASMRRIGEIIGIADLGGPSLDELRKGDSSKGAGKACLFGGHPSLWVDFGEAGIKCTRPAASRSENCGGDNQFQCANHGIQLEAASIDEELCLDPKGDLNDLTVRCSKKLTDILEKKKSALDSDKQAVFLEGLKKQLLGIERQAGMRDENGQAKTIFAYCMAENVEQKPECGAIMEILSVLKGTEVPQVLATAAAASAPAAASSAPPSSGGGKGAVNPPPAAAPAEGTADGPTRQ